MTVFFLVRHASHGLLGKAIAGRSSEVGLNEAGREEAERLAVRLARETVTGLHSSPLRRAVETAKPIARRCGLPIREAPALTELDYGRWGGVSFDALRDEPGWRAYNTFRSGTRIPGGELMAEVQARAIAFLLQLRSAEPAGRIAVVTHGDVIRAVLIYVLGMPLDLLLRLEIAPASVSTVDLGTESVTVLGVNEVAHAP